MIIIKTFSDMLNPSGAHYSAKNQKKPGFLLKKGSSMKLLTMIIFGACFIFLSIHVYADDGVLMSGASSQSNDEGVDSASSRSILVSDDAPVNGTKKTSPNELHPLTPEPEKVQEESETIKADKKALLDAEAVHDAIRFKELKQKLEEDVTKEQVMKHVIEFTKQGMDKDLIITKIKSIKDKYSLTLQDVEFLKQQKVSFEVIAAMPATK
ncbi:MAG: hypothetical protein HQL24_05840 [Candidatus Omnitrophica bacterium]|nr:hypothetical protein [Candidatus Omnitrophota bacterium]